MLFGKFFNLITHRLIFNYNVIEIFIDFLRAW